MQKINKYHPLPVESTRVCVNTTGALAVQPERPAVTNASHGSCPGCQREDTQLGPSSWGRGLAVGSALAREGPGLGSGVSPGRKGHHVACFRQHAQRPRVPPKQKPRVRSLDLNSGFST